MAVRTLPNVERLVVVYLRDHPDVAALVDGRVRTKLPPEFVLPMVRIQRIPGRIVVERHLVAAHVQAEAWAETKAAAFVIAETVRGALHDEPAFCRQHAEGVVSGVIDILDTRWEPDPDTENTPRYLFEAEIYVHPVPS